MEEQVTVCLHQGEMHLMVKTSKEVLEKMEKIRKQDPEQWEMKDIKLMKQAKRVSLELDQLQTIVFSDKCLYIADALTQDEKDGKSLSERFASHDSKKEYFIKEKTSQDTFNILKEAIERAGLKVNVVDKNKILDMLLSSPRFMGRIPSERNGAVSGNSSSRYLDAECEVHLSRIASTDSKSATKLQKETEITRKADIIRT